MSRFAPLNYNTNTRNPKNRSSQKECERTRWFHGFLTHSNNKKEGSEKDENEEIFHLLFAFIIQFTLIIIPSLMPFVYSAYDAEIYFHFISFMAAKHASHCVFYYYYLAIYYES